MGTVRIQRKWVDPQGRLWYVVKGPLAQTGYPQGPRPVAFEQALDRAARMRPAPAPPPRTAPSLETDFPSTTEGLSDEELSALLYRARTALARRAS